MHTSYINMIETQHSFCKLIKYKTTLNISAANQNSMQDITLIVRFIQAIAPYRNCNRHPVSQRLKKINKVFTHVTVAQQSVQIYGIKRSQNTSPKPESFFLAPFALLPKRLTIDSICVYHTTNRAHFHLFICLAFNLKV